ncbi:unnamed protein product [Lepidochelys kempii]
MHVLQGWSHLIQCIRGVRSIKLLLFVNHRTEIRATTQCPQHLIIESNLLTPHVLLRTPPLGSEKGNVSIQAKIQAISQTSEEASTTVEHVWRPVVGVYTAEEAG